MATDQSKSLEELIEDARAITAHILKTLRKGCVKDVIPGMDPAVKRTYDSSFGVLKTYLELKAINAAAQNISIDDLAKLTKEEEIEVYKDPDKLFSILEDKKQNALQSAAGSSAATP